jgi:hypothetical protein
MAAGTPTFYPVVFVTNDIGFFKVSDVNLGMTPFKEFMAFVDQMHIASDAMYLFVKVNHTALAREMTLANVKYDLMFVPVDKIVNIMTHLLPCTPEIKAFCNDPINTAIFHTLYNFYDVCLNNTQSAMASQPQPTTSQTADSPFVDKDADFPSIDQLVEQWADSDTSLDPVDTILMVLTNEDIAIINTNVEGFDFSDCMNIDNAPLVDV